MGQDGRGGPLAPGQRWSVARKREVVLRLLRGEAAEDLSRELGVPVYRLEQWRERALAGIAGALKERGRGDGGRDLARRRPGLRGRAGLPRLWRGALVLLRLGPAVTGRAGHGRHLRPPRPQADDPG
jgi:hypothetical protein